MKIKAMLANVRDKFFNIVRRNEEEPVDPVVDEPVDEETPRFSFVWGVLSPSDYDHNEACLDSENDISVIHDNLSNKYILKVNTMRYFEKDKKGERVFFKKMLKEFTKHMKSVGFSRKARINVVGLHMNDIMSFEDESLARLYAKFRIFVKGFNHFYR